MPSARTIPLRRKLWAEGLEPRYCLSTVAFATHEIDEVALVGHVFVHAADMDSDGDLDVFVAFRTPGSKNVLAAWYENLDGQGGYGPAEVIVMEESNERQLFLNSAQTADLDGDHDLDVLLTLNNDPWRGISTIAWYENTDGRGHFGPRQNVWTWESYSNPDLAYPADLDGDGDLDILSAIDVGDPYSALAWHENMDGAGDFGPPQVIAPQLYGVTSVFPCDLDGDHDLDVLAAIWEGPYYVFSWYENWDGKGSFALNQIIATGLDGPSLPAVYAGDLDGDGDLDALAASSKDDEIWWFANTDGEGTFGSRQLIAEVDGLVSAHVADVDDDGDLDVLSASFVDDKIAWYENLDGLGNFGPQQVITTEADGAIVYAADLDSDGDADVLSASTLDDKITWYENLLPHPGDANRDGRFDTADLVQVLQAGEYEDGIEDNSNWEEGDWNGDGDFTTSDLVLALQTGLYEVKSGLPASKIAAAVDWLFTQDNAKRTTRAFVA